MVKRIVALEGDWLIVPGVADAQKIPQARAMRLCAIVHDTITSRPPIRGSAFRAAEYRCNITPQGHIWVEGDNAAVSEDSRSRFGPVPAALVQGRLVSVLWPPHAMGSVSAAYSSKRLLVMNARAFQDGNDS